MSNIRICLSTTIKILSLLLLTSCRERIAGQEEWYKVEFESLCDKNEHMTSGYQDDLTYGRYNPFDLEIIDTSQTIDVSFKFIAECCLKFTGAANLKDDTLKLTYWNTKESAPCDCICDYKMNYKVKKTKGIWKKVSVRVK